MQSGEERVLSESSFLVDFASSSLFWGRFEELRAQPGQEGLTIEDVVSNLSERCEREGLSLNQLSDQIAGQTFSF